MKTILVVDDIIEVLDLIKETLSVEEDYLIIPVRTGQEAIGVITKIVPDLIILDWYLGKVDNLTGLDTCKTICELHPEIPIMILSGYPQVADVALCNCVVMFMKKPYSPLVLLNVIADIMKQ